MPPLFAVEEGRASIGHKNSVEVDRDGNASVVAVCPGIDGHADLRS
jgi:hypothetical protein